MIKKRKKMNNKNLNTFIIDIFSFVRYHHEDDGILEDFFSAFDLSSYSGATLREFENSFNNAFNEAFDASFKVFKASFKAYIQENLKPKGGNEI